MDFKELENKETTALKMDINQQTDNFNHEEYKGIYHDGSEAANRFFDK